jgi:hypothetical protein
MFSEILSGCFEKIFAIRRLAKYQKPATRPVFLSESIRQRRDESKVSAPISKRSSGPA